MGQSNRKPILSCSGAPQEYAILPGDVLKPKANNTFYWHISTFTDDMEKYKIIHAFELVFNELQRVFDGIAPVGPLLSLESTNDISKADIIISWGSGSHQVYLASGKTYHCPSPFDGARGVLAHVLRDPKGQLHLDDSETWAEMHKLTKDGKLKTHLKTVLMHELGHIWNIAHSNIPAAVMFGSYTGERNAWHSDDLAAWSAVIGPIKTEIKETLTIPPPDLSPGSTAPDTNRGAGCFGIFALVICLLSSILC